MDLMTGQAMRQLRAEITRNLQDRGFFQSKLRRGIPSSNHPLDTEKYNQFMKEERTARKRRQQKLSRQNLAYVIIGTLLPLLLLVLKFLFF